MLFSVISFLSRLILKISGWTLGGERPKEPKFICLASPHTSFVDGFWMVLAAFGVGVHPSYLVKSTYVKGILGRLILWSGGIPVISGAGANKVSEVADYVNGLPQVELVIAPAGTRTKRDSWRSGFYHIAKATELPIYFAYLDFKERRVGINHDPLILTDDPVKDMDVIRNFYAGMEGKHPERMTPICIKEEKVVEA